MILIFSFDTCAEFNSFKLWQEFLFKRYLCTFKCTMGNLSIKYCSYQIDNPIQPIWNLFQALFPHSFSWYPPPIMFPKFTFLFSYMSFRNFTNQFRFYGSLIIFFAIKFFAYLVYLFLRMFQPLFCCNLLGSSFSLGHRLLIPIRSSFHIRIGTILKILKTQTTHIRIFFTSQCT